MAQLTNFFESLTWVQLALIFVAILLPVIVWRLLTAKSGGVWLAKWDDRIEAVTKNMSAATEDMDTLAIRIARSRIVELEIASRSAFLPSEEDKLALETEVRELREIIKRIENRS